MKNILNRVAIAGADEAVEPEALAELSEEFPFVEWSILFDGEAKPLKRFPSENWMERLAEISRKRKTPLNLSLHLCRRAVGELILGNLEWFYAHKDLLQSFQRIQLNVTYKRYESELPSLAKRVRRLPPMQVVVQLNGKEINQNVGETLFSQGIDTVYLFDQSGGAGKTVENWLPPVIHPGGTTLCGYAGGLNPENLRENLDKIAIVCGGVPFWADLESGVRNASDDSFNLLRVRQVLEIANAWIEKYKY